ncbi:hypothetical protein ACKXGF_02575 [Alkalibacillus sp. S2W]|uniref:hypothetical protein n=1 Tax=Alkalibacillus sp. S2W TaxID=3386553 RepID=UPI00398CD230
MFFTKVELKEVIQQLEDEVSIKDIRMILKKDKSQISYLMKNYMNHYYSKGNRYFVKKEDFIQFLNKHNNYHLLIKNSPLYISSDEIKEEYSDLFFKYDISELNKALKPKRINLDGFKKMYKLPRKEVKEFYEKRKESLNKIDNSSNKLEQSFQELQWNENYIYHTVLRKEMGCPDWYLPHLVKHNKLPKSIIFSNHRGYCFIHKDDINKAKDMYSNKEVFGRHSFIDYSNEKSPYDRFLNIINNQSMEHELPRTHQLYDDFILHFINHSKTHYKMNAIANRAKAYVSLRNLLTKEVYLLSNKEVEFLFQQDIYKTHKENIKSFLSFVKSRERTQYNVIPQIKNINIKDKNKHSIYSKNEFFKMYRHVIRMDIHLEKSIDSFEYCQDWFFLLMSFSNAWRVPDISNMPSPRLTLLNKENISFEWFQNSRLTISESTRLLKDIQQNHNHKINKTGGLNEFFVPNDMIVPIATSLVLLELYRKERNENTNTLMPRYKKSVPNGKQLKRLFIGDFPYYVFSHVTKSLLTYSYVTANKMGTHAGAANAISTRLRGHKDEDTIQHYVLPTIDDPSDATRHLFRRGHFGFLYSLLVDLWSKNEEREITMEEKTESIESLMNIFTSNDVENVANFFFDQRSKLQSVADRVAKMSSDDISQHLESIHNGEMPSYKLEAQCFVSGNCVQLNKNCNSCPFLIPKITFLNSAKTELYDLIDKLKNINEDNINERVKTTHLILSLLGVVNQSVKTFGKEYASEYIDFQHLKGELTSVQYKMLE